MSMLKMKDDLEKVFLLVRRCGCDKDVELHLREYLTMIVLRFD